jgi:hypothetical protein
MFFLLMDVGCMEVGCFPPAWEGRDVIAVLIHVMTKKRLSGIFGKPITFADS